ALDLADAKPAPDERVEVDATGEDVSTRGGGAELDSGLREERLERLGSDQRDVAVALGLHPRLGGEIAVALEATRGDRVDPRLRIGKLLVSGGDVDLDDDAPAARWAAGHQPRLTCLLRRSSRPSLTAPQTRTPAKAIIGPKTTIARRIL